jgi:hypothetical protein
MRLPHSGQAIGFRELDGVTEALIAELPPDRPIAGGIALLDALMLAETGTAADLTLTDFETALVGLRCHLAGDAAASAPVCPHCGEQVEWSFSFAALAAAAVPRVPRGVARTLDGGSIAGATFRLPRAGDARDAEGLPDAPQQLLAACSSVEPTSPLARRIERALARVAPLLSRVISAPCAACTALLRATLHVPSFVVGELAWRAQGVFEDVHAIALGYGWPEGDILALPSARRRRYAALLREAR